MTDERHETEIRDALSRLSRAIDVPPPDPERQQALLARFDAHWAAPRATSGRWIWMPAAAALIAITTMLCWVVVRDVSPGEAAGAAERAAVLDPDMDMTGFVEWPGARALPPFESGEV